MFIGRNSELSELERLYETDKIQCATVWGSQR